MNGNIERWLLTSDLVPPDVLNDMNLTHSATPPARVYPARVHIAPMEGDEREVEATESAPVEFGFDAADDGTEGLVYRFYGVAPALHQRGRGAALVQGFGNPCPCGAEANRRFAPYCSYDCVPTRAVNSEPGDNQMHWRPDLVTAIDDTHLKPWFRRRRYGDLYVEILERAGTGQMHVRLDNDHRWVGADLPLEPVDTFGDRYEAKLRALRRELDNDRHLVPAPGTDPAQAHVHWSDRPAQQLHDRMWARVAQAAAVRTTAERQETLRRVRARHNPGPRPPERAPRRVDPQRGR